MPYVIHNREFDDESAAERYLTALFDDMCSDLEIDFGNDGPAWRECFHNWTDSLHRDNIICDNSARDLCPVGSRFD